ncbi:alpha/beta hydrolase-fold protein [Pelomonas sp. SE-A7]|uniref:alpha/beta hydrolase n=1 Tax=Pelomonas sp. SE-A7 TaxID=3054953 RepID=UPI00259C7FE0|nr:alpha/beta hydrolase-fold protein [Pelomonas sp. SE-A7]MDM4767007.1 alpha/beta hydrolase-fold protein [Pelomonas sp. SE-A7]
MQILRRSLLAAALALAGTPSFATELQVEPLVIGESLKLDSKVLAETRRINVYLPAGYAEQPNARFPVMLMPDGGLAEDFLHLAGLLQVSMANGTMRPFILVGIENTERRRDLTGPTEQASDRKIAPRVGGSAAFRQFIREELMPAIKARYRTTNESALIGESLAGLFVVETWALEPQLFDHYIAFDPSLWWNKEALTTTLKTRLRYAPLPPKPLYIANSSEPTIYAPVRRFIAVLKDAKLKGWQHEAMPAETHATIYHPAALKALRLLFKPAKP